MSWRFLPGADAWSWDYSILDPLIKDHRPLVLKMLGYMLDNIFERQRYLTGALSQYVGISVARAFQNIKHANW